MLNPAPLYALVPGLAWPVTQLLASCNPVTGPCLYRRLFADRCVLSFSLLARHSLSEEHRFCSGTLGWYDEVPYGVHVIGPLAGGLAWNGLVG